MAVKYVCSTAAAKQLSAWVVLNKKGEHVGTVRAHFGGGTYGSSVTVNIWCNREGDVQVGRGNNLESALHGLTLDGHTLYDHSSKNAETERLMEAYIHDKERIQPKMDQACWDNKARKIGAYFANWSSRHEAFVGRARFASLFMYGGLKRLDVLGYQVIQAI